MFQLLAQPAKARVARRPHRIIAHAEAKKPGREAAVTRGDVAQAAHGCAAAASADMDVCPSGAPCPRAALRPIRSQPTAGVIAKRDGPAANARIAPYP